MGSVRLSMEFNLNYWIYGFMLGLLGAPSPIPASVDFGDYKYVQDLQTLVIKHNRSLSFEFDWDDMQMDVEANN